MKAEFLKKIGTVLAALALSAGAWAQSPTGPDDQGTCKDPLNYTNLKAALVAAAAADKSGFNNQLYATLVDRDGTVCAVAFSGVNRLAQPLSSRVFSAVKANTANGFSSDGISFSNGSGQPSGLAQSTANLYNNTQPGGVLWGYADSSPVNPGVAYAGPSWLYGSPNDPMVGQRIGGINLTGGGLALYATGHKLIGAVGVSGDTPCRDHNIAWYVRKNLGLDHMAQNGAQPPVFGPAGLFAGDVTHPDNIVFDIPQNPAGGAGVSKSGIGHASCPLGNDPLRLPPVQP